jgi:DNA adenine methylase
MADFRWKDCPVVIPYYGGKFELSRKLVPMLWDNHNRYIEMFFGGGSMFFRKRKSKFNVLNDLHNDLINLYITIIDNYDEFYKESENLLKSRTLFDNFKNEIKTIEYIDIPDPLRAAKYYYVIKNAFNHTVFNAISKEQEWHKEMLEDLKISRKILENTMIENLDFRTLLEKYPPKEDDMWYLDPPYIVAGERGDYYFHSLNMDDHKALRDICNEIHANKGKFMVSYDNREEVRELYRDYKITEIPIIYAGQLHKRDMKIELVITNYKPQRMQESLFD